jgi:hypothetical protein
MKPLALFISLVLAGICGAHTLRISEVAEQAGDDAERMTMIQDGKEEVLFVKKHVVIGDGDVKNAFPSQVQEGAISVSLTEEGGRKIKEVTSRIRLSKDRLAIVVNGKLVSAPVVNAVLGGNFEITGLKDMGHQELAGLAEKRTGPQPPPAPEEGFENNGMALYQPDDVLKKRLPSVEKFGDYIVRLQAVCERFFKDGKEPELLDIVVAVRPDKSTKVWLVSSMHPEMPPERAFLLAELEKVEPCEVVSGPVALLIAGRIAGGDGDIRGLPMPAEWTEAVNRKPGLSVPDGILNEIWPQRK